MVDARLTELLFLLKVSQAEKSFRWQNRGGSLEEREMVADLIRSGYLNDLTSGAWMHGPELWRDRKPGREPSKLEEDHERRAWEQVNGVLAGQDQFLRLSHRGRLRMAQLRDALDAQRWREPFGILFDGSFVIRDLELALAVAGETSPLCVGFLDQNGLRAINETHGPEIGDEALRALLRSVKMFLGDTASAYRGGGDEVVILWPGLGLDEAEQEMDAILALLGQERVLIRDGQHITLSAACGLTQAEVDETAAEVGARAQEALTAAKGLAHSRPAKSTLAVSGKPPVIVGSSGDDSSSVSDQSTVRGALPLSALSSLLSGPSGSSSEQRPVLQVVRAALSSGPNDLPAPNSEEPEEKSELEDDEDDDLD